MHPVLAVFLTCAIILLLVHPAVAFGAGDIPDYAYLNDRAFRHGDIESVLSNLAKSVGGAAAGGGLMSIAASVLSSATGGAKFSKMDVKRVYFGNWLRDYSQAMDIAGLSKLTAQSLVTVVTVLGFMTFGFATAEFEVTADRLGVYLPIEHIDNPKGYAEKEGDAREFHPKLRPPVNPEELEINPRNGMKNYIATEGQSWDTSSAHVRRTLRQCIEYGRRARGEENNDQWEAFRLLGTALHTLEDLLAHSNWCELSLRKMGHQEVFCHVGDEVLIDTPNGQAPPLVTGTFGSADFMHSVLGEGMDHLSEASVTNLTGKMDEAKNQGEGPISTLKSLLSKLPSTGDSSNEEKMEQAEDIKQKAYDFDPDNVAPEDVQHQMWQVLEWRDSIYRDILKKIEMIPGLSELLEELTNALNAYVFTVLEPVLTPILQQATGVLQDGSKAVIDTCDQFEVFNDPNASDPSHSILSKDHFGLILNEPAGKVAQVVVEYSVNLIVKAWYDENEDPDRIIDQILETFHHPYFATGDSEIQRLMTDHLERWIGGLGSEEGQQTLQALTKESVRAGRNKRLGSNDDTQVGKTSDGEYGESLTGDNTGEGQYGAGGYKDVRYKPNPPSQPTYTRYDGQQRDDPERHRRSDIDEYSSEQYGVGRHGRGERRDESGYDETPTEPRYNNTRAAYGQSTAEPYGGERYTETRTTEYGGVGYTARQEYSSEGHSGVHRSGRESYKPSYDAGDESQSYGQGTQAYGGGSQTYGRDQGYSGGGQSYEGRTQFGGNESYEARNPSYGGNQPNEGGDQSYDRANQSYGGRDSYGGETQPYGGMGRGHGRNEGTSYGATEGYTRGDGYEGGRGGYEGRRGDYEGGREDYEGGHGGYEGGHGGYEGGREGYEEGRGNYGESRESYEGRRGGYGEGAGHGRQARSYGDGGQQGYGREADSETFGAEGLSLEDNGRRHGQPGYGRGLRRGVDDYFNSEMKSK